MLAFATSYFEYCLVLLCFSSKLALLVFDATENRWLYLLQNMYSILLTNVLMLENNIIV